MKDGDEPYPCPYLKGEAELTEERERHIAERHPDLLPEHRGRIAKTLAKARSGAQERSVRQRQTVLPVVY
jgi:hypothetical protein